MEPNSEKSFSAEDGTSRNSRVEDSCLESQMANREAEKKLLRTCDLYVIPSITVLYMLAFIDRINIGNARIQGLEKDLGMKGNDYNVALLVFFVPYVLFEVPSNLIIKKIAPSTWLSSIMACWGMVEHSRYLCWH